MFFVLLFFFFFQAEDGIRDKLVTGVKTCALPICSASWTTRVPCLPANVCRCAQEIGSAFKQGVDHTSASIRTTRFRPANGRTRKRYRNNARSSWRTRTRRLARCFVAVRRHARYAAGGGSGGFGGPKAFGGLPRSWH